MGGRDPFRVVRSSVEVTFGGSAARIGCGPARAAGCEDVRQRWSRSRVAVPGAGSAGGSGVFGSDRGSRRADEIGWQGDDRGREPAIAPPTGTQCACGTIPHSIAFSISGTGGPDKSFLPTE
jgi:hypothetical protein